MIVHDQHTSQFSEPTGSFSSQLISPSQHPDSDIASTIAKVNQGVCWTGSKQSPLNFEDAVMLSRFLHDLLRALCNI